MGVMEESMVPPDGGWGWVVVFAANIINLCIRSLDSTFGLLFGDLLKELDVGTTGAALITSSLDCVIHLFGLITGPIVRICSYRKVSAFGGFICFVGILLIYPARSVVHLFICYSVIFGLGMSLAATATFIALNNYFRKRIGLAAGFSILGAAVGMMLLPHLVRFLLEEYGFPGAILILASIMLHIIVGACLLEPAERHLVPARQSKYIQPHIDSNVEEPYNSTRIKSPQHTRGLQNVKTDPNLFEGRRNEISITGRGTLFKKFSVASLAAEARPFSLASSSEMDYPGSGVLYFEIDNKPPAINPRSTRLQRSLSHQPTVQEGDYQHSDKECDLDARKSLVQNHEELESQHPPKRIETPWMKIVRFFDFELLQNPVYLNLIFGLSMQFVSDQNFKMVAPFFFENIGFNKKDVAMFLSCQAFGDIFSRIILPPVFDKIPFNKRTLFMISIALVAITRSVLANQTNYTSIILCLVVGGFCRGGGYVTYTVTITESTTHEKLPAAFGLHMVAKGINSIIIGPIIGYIRDVTGSYSICMYIQASLLLLTCLMWTTEYVFFWIKAKNTTNSGIQRKIVAS